MNDKQRAAKEFLQQELRIRRRIAKPLPDIGEIDGYFFTEVEGVTVIIGPRGGYLIPAVRSYPETSRAGEKDLHAAVYADEHWNHQAKEGDYKTGHLDRIVDLTWMCRSAKCPCKREPHDQRRKRSTR